MDEDQLGYLANDRGYQITYKGKRLGGAGVAARPKHWRHQRANLKMFSECAQREVEELRAGRGEPRFRLEIERIDAE